ncbi:transketolase-like TK C-terminal-containing protein [Acetobacter sp.]|uniref:transketolase-like TK C-terminal-containing protein n=1 Tax=Acetobacter sp. TaxID=440 RepID=UPI0039E79D20
MPDDPQHPARISAEALAAYGFAQAVREHAAKTGLSSFSEDAIPEPFWLVATVLWRSVLRFDTAAPLWPDRDRFFVSSTRLLPLRNALLSLSGSSFTSAKGGRSTTPDMAQELFGLAGGLPGQAIAAAAGMALAEKVLTRRFGRSLVDHRVWLLAAAGDLDTGVALEAAALAARLRLDRLTVIVPDTTRRPEEKTDLALALDRIEASGWSIRRVDGADPLALEATLNAAQRLRRPGLILCTQSNSAPPTHLDSGFTMQSWREAPKRRQDAARRGWLRRLARHPLRAEFERTLEGRSPQRLEDDFMRDVSATGSSLSLVEAGLAGRDILAALLPEFISLSAGHGHSARLNEENTPSRERDDVLACGPREPAMVGLMNGLALHGGILSCGIADLSSADRMRPALRFAALSRRRLLFVLVEDDPHAVATPPWRQVEQLASLRAMPNLALFRPADAEEVASAWLSAFAWRHGPAVLVLGRELSAGSVVAPSAAIHGHKGRKPEYGGYVLAEAAGGQDQRDVTLIASGPEVRIALLAQKLLLELGTKAAVVSLPCWELFERQDAEYRQAVLGTRPRVAIEAASGFGWERWLGDTGIFIGSEEFSMASGFNPLYQNADVTPEAVCNRVHDLLAMTRKQPVRAQTATQKRGGDTRLRPSPIVKSNQRPSTGR